MVSKINVEVNGTVYSFDKNITPAKAIELTNAPYVSGSCVCIVKKQKKEKAAPIKEYVIQTTKGVLIIELNDPSSLSSQIWMESFEHLSSCPILFESSDALSFGPFKTNYDIQKGIKRYHKYDVILSAGGFDTTKTMLVFSKKEHYADYGTPEESVFATLIAGRTNLEQIDKGDMIESIRPYSEESETMGEGACTTDLSVSLADGDRLVTFAEVEMSPHSPRGAETFYALTKDGTFTVHSSAVAFRSDDTLKGEPCEYENFEPRKVGTVCLRTAGLGRGRVYISAANRASSLLHSVIGHVVSGTELPYFSKNGDQFTIETSPPHLLLLGRSVEESGELLKAIGIKMEINGYDGKDNVIVSQNPSTTLDILREAKVTVTTVPKSKLIEVEFYYDEAPKSVEFFRHSIDLKTQPVGSLPASMIYDETYIFKAEKQAEKYKEIMPENTPKKAVKAFDIGITNQSAKRVGYIGVRLADESMFGPTGEKFDATNIIGRVLNPENLKNVSEGDYIYIKEIGARQISVSDEDESDAEIQTEEELL